jgi:hypothetical protein
MVWAPAADLADQNARAGGFGPVPAPDPRRTRLARGKPDRGEPALRGPSPRGGRRAGPWAPLRALAGARLGVLKLEAGDIPRGTALLRDALGTAATVGDRPAAAAAIEGLASVALRIAGAERAAALLGAADSVRGTVDHSSLDAPGIRAAAKEQLGEAAFDAAYRRGLGLPYDEALGFAQASGYGE